MLASYYVSHSQGQKDALVVFLHGFLGSSKDWYTCLSYLKSQHVLCIDLPCHGASRYCSLEALGSSAQTSGFDQSCAQIQATILQQLAKQDLPQDMPVVLVGYSLGGRLLMYGLAEEGFPLLNIQACVVEGGNFGLQDETAKIARRENDNAWACDFATEAIEEVLEDWYSQAVFASLTEDQKENYIRLRSENLGTQVARMLRATSLAKQPYLLDKIKALETPFLYLCGEHDEKFVTLAKESGLHYQSIKDAGHNAHSEQPLAFTQAINRFITACLG